MLDTNRLARRSRQARSEGVPDTNEPTAAFLLTDTDPMKMEPVMIYDLGRWHFRRFEIVSPRIMSPRCWQAMAIIIWEEMISIAPGHQSRNEFRDQHGVELNDTHRVALSAAVVDARETERSSALSRLSRGAG